MNETSEPRQAFIAFLEGLVKEKDRGALAALRRGLGKAPGTAMEMHRYVAPFLPRERPWEEEHFYLVAALFAYWHQGEIAVASEPPENLGASLARLNTADTGPSLEMRFTALLKSHRDDLPVHLRHAVGLLKSKGVAVDWERLWRDLRWWDREDGRVQRGWAKSFWGVGSTSETKAMASERE